MIFSFQFPKSVTRLAMDDGESIMRKNKDISEKDHSDGSR